MGRPEPHQKNQDGLKSGNGNNSTKRKRFKKFMMGSSKDTLGFASIKEKRIVRRFKKYKRKVNMEMCYPFIENSSLLIENRSLEMPHSTNKPHYKISKSSRNSVIQIDYEKIQEERQLKLEELQASVSHEKEVKKRIKKRKKLTKQLMQKTERGQPLMSNHLQHLLGKIQVAKGKT